MHQLIHYNMGSKSAIGIGNGICFKQVRDKGGGSYIDPLVRDSIVGLWKFDQNTNESPTRNIIKNTIKDKGGDLELLNFAYKANSGYNGYPEDFTSWNTSTYNVEVSKDGSKVKSINNTKFALQYSYTTIGRDIPSFKVKISNFTEGYIKYFYRNEEGVEEVLTFFSTDIDESEIIELPKSYNIVENGTGIRGGFDSTNINIGVTIEQLPLYEGALVTDGKDDMIVSQKTVQEMLGGSKKITVVSMIHQIGRVATNTNLFTNCIQYNTGSKGHNIVNYQTSLGKTGIYGYSRANVSVANNEVVINNILGDKADYLTNVSIGALTSNEKFSVVGYLDVSPQQVTSVAVYWTFIANKVLTTDEINQIIGYYKLDKYVTPQVIYDVKRQGLTNDTPAADWYLKDFSGNGHDMQLYNYAKELNSGVGKYAENFTTWNKYNNVVVTKDKISVNSLYKSNWLVYKQSTTRIAPMKVKIIGIPASGRVLYRHMKSSSDIAPSLYDITEDGIHDLPESLALSGGSVGFMLTDGLDWTHIEITQIPDYEGALVSDGKDDYGKAEGLPILKDYTVAVDRAIIGTNKQVDGGVSAKCLKYNNGSYVIDYLDGSFSYGGYLAALPTIDRIISYQSKYISNGKAISPVNTIDANEIYIAKLGIEERYSTIAIWSYLLFPYSLSEFLLERQLKKYKLGTLYPNMVEFRPIVSGNIPYDKIEISQGSTVLYTEATDKTGIYLQEGSTVRVYIRSSGVDEVSKITINGIEYTDLPINVNGYYYADFPITKSPQKISYVIDEYIRFEDIVQPYPAIVNLSQDGKSITWGDKLKVGSELVFVNHTNLLPELYTSSGGVFYNGKILYSNTAITAEKSMVFTNVHGWKLNTTEPHAILSPQKLNIPNYSLKILGYVPDLTGKGNHGKLNNFAYTEDSGVAADGSIKFDGTDDHITIPTLAHGGKCVMMKVNLQNYDTYLYDQRNQWSQYLAIVSAGKTVAYNYSNQGGKTYIDGILNENIIDKDLIGITHNITVANSGNVVSYSPNIGTSFAKGNFANMSLYEFMLFPEIPSEDEIKKLNDVMGIEGGYVESPNYYWDAYGKKNTDTDRNLIADQVSKDVANALEVKNVGYNSESGYTDDNGLLLDGVEDHAVNTVIPAVTDFTVIAKREFPESALANNQTFLIKGDAINGNNNVNSLLMECYYGAQNYIISFSYQQIVPLEESKISWITPTSYNGNALTKGSGVDSAGLTIGRYRDLYRKAVFYKAMFYTKTIDQLSINMLKNLFERDELIDITNPIFKKKEL